MQMSGTKFSHGIPDKPQGLSTDESRYWDELIDQLPVAVLKQTDSRLLRELCSAVAIERRVAALTNEEDHPDRSQVLDIFFGAVGLVVEFSPMFGLTPKDRERMVIKPQEPDDFVDWMEQ